METLTITRSAWDNHNNQMWVLLWNGMYYQYNGEEWVLYPYTITATS